MVSFKSLVVSAAVLALPGAAQAAVIYNLTLTSSDPAYSGTGTITLNAAPSATGLTSYAAGQFSDLSFIIAGQTFTPPLASVGAVQFLNGAFRDITFSQTIGASPSRYALMMTDRYAFYYNNLQSAAYGTIRAAPADTTGPVPEPATWAMMLIGFGLVGGALRHRRRTRVTYS